MTRRLLPLIVVAAALSSTACVEPVLHSAIGYHELDLHTDADLCAGNLEGRIEPSGELLGPHFALAVTCVLTTDTTADLEGLFEQEPAPLPPPPGYMFLVVQYALDYATEPPYEDTDGIAAAIELGDRSLPLERLPDEGTVQLLTLPVGGSAAIAVTDEGRTQKYDLIARTRIDEVAAYYAALTGEPLNETYAFWVDTVSLGFASTNGNLRFVRDYWTPDGGWPEADRATVVAEIEWTDFSPLGVELRIDIEKAVTLAAGTETVRPSDVSQKRRKGAVEVPDFGNGNGNGNEKVECDVIVYRLVFEVPANAAVFTAKFKPKVTFLSDGRPDPVRKQPSTKKYKLDFTRR